MNARRLTAAVSVALLAACAGTPGPGDSGYMYNVIGPYTGQFVVDGQALPGTMQLETAAGGAVTGTFAVQMMGITGDLEGMVVDDQLTFKGNYHNGETGCDGIAEVTATIGEDGTTIRGRIEVSECGQFLSGTVRFSR
jgi:hypothetical protein